MIKALENQRIQINVIDVDSKQIINEPFLIYKGVNSDLPGVSADVYMVIKDGSYFMDINGLIYGDYLSGYFSEITFDFVESQITALGYDFNSISGNIIKPIYDPKTELYCYPWIVNIYMKKL